MLFPHKLQVVSAFLLGSLWACEGTIGQASHFDDSNPPAGDADSNAAGDSHFGDADSNAAGDSHFGDAAQFDGGDVVGDLDLGDAGSGETDGDMGAGDPSPGDGMAGDANAGDVGSGDLDTGDATQGDSATPPIDACTSDPTQCGTDDEGGPIVFWASEPVAPDETILVTAGRIDASAEAQLARLVDDPPGTPISSATATALSWLEVTPIAASTRSAALVIPASFSDGVFALRLFSGGLHGPTRFINAPDPWFVVGDLGDAVSPGGVFTVAGVNLAKDGATPRACLVKDGSLIAELTLAGTRASHGYGLDWAVGQSVAPGSYELWVHNGRGGPAAWVRYSSFTTELVDTVTVAAPVVWPSNVVNVATQAGVDDDARFAAAIAALKSAGGGVLYAPAGTYHLNNQLMLPAQTILRGDGRTATTLVWDSSPTEEFNGSSNSWVDQGQHVPLVRSWFVTWGMPGRVNFAIEDLAIHAPADYGSDYSPNAHAVGRQFITEFGWLRRLEIAVPHRPATAERGPPDLRPIMLRRTRNTEISDCVLSGNTGIYAREAVSFTRIENNAIRWSQAVFWLSAGSRSNLVSNNVFDQVGDSIANGWVLIENPNPGVCFTAFNASSLAPPFNRDCLLSGNTTTRQEAEIPPGHVGYTSDGGDGVYVGGVSGVSGTALELATAASNTIDYAGGIVQILDGTGAGQLRYVASLPAGGTSVTLDRPFAVTPDATSWVTVVNLQGRLLMVDNDFTQFRLLQDYFNSLDTIKAHNRLGVAGANTGLPHWAGHHYNATIGAWHTQILDNHVVQGTNTGMISMVATATAGYEGVVGAAHVYRNTTADEAAGATSITLRTLAGPFADALIEQNLVDTILLNRTTDPPVDLRGVVVLRGNKARSGSATPVTPTVPDGVVVLP